MLKLYARYRIILMLADIAITLTMFAVMAALRPYMPGRLIEQVDGAELLVIYVAVALLWYLVFLFSGVYDVSRIPSFSQQVSRFTAANVLAVFAFAGLLYFSFREVSRMLVIYFCASNYIALLLVRYGLIRYLRAKHTGGDRSHVLIVGCNDRSIGIAETILRHHDSIYELVGFADDYCPFGEQLPAPLLGSVEDVPALIREGDFELVVIALPEERARDVEKLVVDLYPLPVRVYIVPDLFKITLIHSEVETFGDNLVIGIREPVIQGTRRAVKRAFDLAAAALLVLLTWPLMLIIWIAVKLDSPGPAIYRASRVGENGRIFDMLKYRSMYVDADRQQEVVTINDEAGHPIYKRQLDPRVTRVGRILRRTSLDELPQLFNVLKGEMSLVGPRPEQPFITGSYDYWQWQRLSVPPGITGWWQVSGRSDLPLHLNTQYDLYYVRNYSFLLDLKILLKTIVVVLRGQGAY
jgi:exopolysaccharide biosynthesis polyprenyl glycosylphosphotransferase